MAGAARAACGVERGAAAADDDEPAAERRRRSRVRRGEPRRPVDDPRLSVIERRQSFLPLRARRNEHGVVCGAQCGPRRGRVRLRVQAHVHPQRHNAGDLGIEHVARESIRRDAVAHQPAEFAARLEQRDAVAEAAQLVGRRQSRGTAADDRDALQALDRRRVERPAARDGNIAHEALELADRQRLVVAGAVACRLARVMADASGDRGERIVAGKRLPRTAKVALAREPDPRRDVAVDRAGGVARRRRQHVTRQRSAPRPGADRLGGRRGPDRRDECVHAAAASSIASAIRKPAWHAARFSSTSFGERYGERAFQCRQRRRADGTGERAEQRRVDDAAESRNARDGDRVDGQDAIAGQRAGELLRAAARVHDHERARVRRREEPPFEQRRVEAEDRVGALDVAAQPYRRVVDADVRGHRRAAPRAAIAREALHVLAFGEERGREQVARRLRALSPAALDDDFEHRPSLRLRATPGSRLPGQGRPGPLIRPIDCWNQVYSYRA